MAVLWARLQPLRPLEEAAGAEAAAA